MRVIKACQIGETMGYQVDTTTSDGTVVSSRKVVIPIYEIEKDGYTNLFLVNDTDEIIHEAYKYLNRKCRHISFNSRLQKARGIRLLYCFLSVTGYDIGSLNRNAIGEMVYFMQGLGIQSSEETPRIVRSNKTVNLYISAVRDYLKYLGIENAAINDSSIVRYKTISSDTGLAVNSQQTKYDVSLRTTSKNDRMVPKYISPDEFRSLYAIARRHKDTTAMILMHLMYVYGLRLGECLGLTVPEDLQQITVDGKPVPVLIIRNRLSDNPTYQSSKGKPHVTSKDQYRTSDYQKMKDQIQITWNFYEQLIEYINETQEYFSENYPDNYDTGEADIVSVRNKPDYNHYLFMNRYGKRLSDHTWNNILKGYFLEAGISIDSGKKTEGLSHRFRHGFAMFYAQFSTKPVDALRLSKMMRHRSPVTTMIYYNPTPEDELKMKEEAQKYLYDSIPELAMRLESTDDADESEEDEGD